jgi:hypothetical protein
LLTQRREQEERETEEEDEDKEMEDDINIWDCRFLFILQLSGSANAFHRRN